MLDRLVENVRAGQSRVLVLRGEAGVGKTALLEYLQGRASGCRIARAAGVESEMELPVPGLADRDARALLASVITGPLDERVRDRIVAETRGNPLALWEGGSLDTLLEGVATSAGVALGSSSGGSSTNLPLEDLTDHTAWIAFGSDGQELEPEHDGPAAGPASVVVEERQVGPRDPARGHRRARLWERLGDHNYGDPGQEQRLWGDGGWRRP